MALHGETGEGRGAAANVVILGCGRSGTSIFGELFEALPGYRYLSEPPFEALEELDWNQPTAIKVPRPKPGAPTAPGLPFTLEALLAVVPAPRRIVWQVRHPLDAIASLRVGIAQDWGHHPRPPDWRDWLERPLLHRCAHHWLYINEAGFAEVERLAVVRCFEDMIADPLGCAEAACHLVGIDPNACAPDLARWARRVQDTNNADFDEAACSRPYSRPDHARRVGRWRENLDPAEVADLVPLLKSAAAQFGYSLSD